METHVIRAGIDELQNRIYSGHRNRPPLPATVGYQTLGEVSFEYDRDICEACYQAGKALPATASPIAEVIQLNTVESAPAQSPYRGGYGEEFHEDASMVPFEETIEVGVAVQRIVLTADQAYNPE